MSERNLVTHPGPICPVCTTDWDEKLGYCETCAQRLDARNDHRSNANTPGLWEDNFS